MRKGAGTDLWESKESKMPSQLSSISAIERGKKKQERRSFQREEMVRCCGRERGDGE